LKGDSAFMRKKMAHAKSPAAQTRRVSKNSLLLFST
jgi:hypothetical protein